MSPKIKRNNTKKVKLNNTTGLFIYNLHLITRLLQLQIQVENTISWASAGSAGFKGARKGTPLRHKQHQNGKLTALNLGLKKLIFSLKVKDQVVKQQYAQSKTLV